MYNIVETGSNIDAYPQYKPMIESMIAEYKPANTECPVSKKIVLEERTKPFRHQPSRHSAVESESNRKQVDAWLQDGIVRKSSSNFASRVVLVKKKDGTDRICVDFRRSCWNSFSPQNPRTNSGV
ncbi:GM16556 [Drosophila sechellia]|uniref:GM16556 n=1 Tax=Drosophila sechellia TaxID=7238 RepID=B4INU2_DROSE|nr:GM24638 [Drosophila sechellia]EDW53784.1 GM16556 [Drosophila sechellia]